MRFVEIEKVYCLRAYFYHFFVFLSSKYHKTKAPFQCPLLYYSTQTLTSVGEDLFVGTFGAGVLKYDFENSTWIELPIDYKFIRTLASDDDGNIYAGTSGNGVYVTQNGGDNWSQINTGLPNQHNYLISTFEDNVYAATWFGGIYKLTGTDGNWQSIGMSGIQISSIGVDGATGTLFAGTSSGTVYKMKSTATKVNTEIEIPSEYELSQNYPNPFNPSTTISYQIPQVIARNAKQSQEITSANSLPRNDNVQVQLKIYDILGREVAALVNKQQKPGYYEVNWNAAEMPSGIYLYRIQAYPITGGAAQFVKTNKMILLK